MTKTQFRQKAIAQPVSVLGQPLSVDPVQHKTGSCGYRTRFSMFVKIGDEYVKVLGSITLTAVGSKKWEK